MTRQFRRWIVYGLALGVDAFSVLRYKMRRRAERLRYKMRRRAERRRR